MSETVIELENISRSFKVNNCETIFDYLKLKNFKKKEEIIAVDHVSFKITEGEIVGLLGINGAGKSTLIKMMVGILKPSSGKIKVLGNDPFEQRMKNNRKIAAVFGQRCQLRWDISPMESYKLFQVMYQIPEEEFQKRLNELVQVLEIENIINQPVRTLSLGQKMRADLVGALLHQPQLLFLDEPTLGLDVFSKDAIIKFLIACKEKMNVTVIFTSHDMESVEKLCDRLIVINEGKMIVDDKMDNLSNYTNLNTKITFKIHKEAVIVPPEIAAYNYIVDHNEISFLDIEKDNIVEVISFMLKKNEVSEIEIKKPEFKDIFMKLFHGPDGEREK